jgi:hypothetical protein
VLVADDDHATIDKTVPAELDVHLICDDSGTHKTPAIRARTVDGNTHPRPFP